MTAPTSFRPAAALALAAGLFLALPGCGDKPKSDDKGGKSEGKKDGPTPQPPTPGGPDTNPGTNPGTTPRPPEKVDFTSGAGKEAMDFLQEVRAGTAKADRLTEGFRKAVGLPVVFDADKAKGYSADAAEGWLKRVGAEVGFAPALFSKQTGDVAFLKGLLVGKPGGYALRMANEGGKWKADWLSASSVQVSGTTSAPTADGIAQEFAATAVFEAVCDKDAMGHDERAAVIAAGMTPALRRAWAEPFDGDKAKGYDYNPAKLIVKAAEVAGGAESVGFTPQADALFRAEVTRPGGAKATYLVKLVKGTTPGQWLVESITPQ